MKALRSQDVTTSTSCSSSPRYTSAFAGADPPLSAGSCTPGCSEQGFHLQPSGCNAPHRFAVRTEVYGTKRDMACWSEQLHGEHSCFRHKVNNTEALQSELEHIRLNQLPCTFPWVATPVPPPADPAARPVLHRARCAQGGPCLRARASANGAGANRTCRQQDSR